MRTIHREAIGNVAPMHAAGTHSNSTLVASRSSANDPPPVAIRVGGGEQWPHRHQRKRHQQREHRDGDFETGVGARARATVTNVPLLVPRTPAPAARPPMNAASTALAAARP